MSSVTRDESRAYYEEFSLAVGARDWLSPNRRHLKLKLLVRQMLDGRSGLRIADVGCGAGLMTDYLTRFGSVVGVDFSTAAIEAAKRWAPTPTFFSGGLEALPDSTYDVITLFDVLEHIPLDERPGFVADLSKRLSAGGLLFCSTPFPSSTRRRKDIADPTLQIVDEEVELPAVTSEAAAAGLQLLSFTTYDVFSGSPEYQAMVFSPTRIPGVGVSLTTRDFRLVRRIGLTRSARILRRLRYGLRAARHGQLRTACWFLTAPVPHVKS